MVEQAGGPYAGQWMLPGGRIEVGESAHDSAAREFREETGLEPLELTFFALYEERGSWTDAPFHVLLIAYRAHATGEPRPAEGEGEARWMDPVQLASAHAVVLRVLVDARLLQADAAAALAAAGIRMERVDR
ncbi:hypothetical protein BH18CHL2_BH18CHL2_09890 [soil metagenome]